MVFLFLRKNPSSRRYSARNYQLQGYQYENHHETWPTQRNAHTALNRIHASHPFWRAEHYNTCLPIVGRTRSPRGANARTMTTTFVLNPMGCSPNTPPHRTKNQKISTPHGSHQSQIHNTNDGRCQERSILSQSSSARVPYNIKPIFSRTINLQMIHNLVELAFQLVKTFKSLFSALDLASIAAS